MTNIVPVILAGGEGKRLWPLSRKSYPKQFSKLIGELSLFQQTAIRLNSSKSFSFAAPLILTNFEYRFIVTEQLNNIGLNSGGILIEPETKNTAPAILAACLYMEKLAKNSTILVCPSDHFIPDTHLFHDAIKKSLPYVEKGKIVTFGITPTRPETGYGYLEVSGKFKSKISEVHKFIEKPELNAAVKMLGSGNFYWNSGIFMFKVKDLIAAFSKYAHETLRSVQLSVQEASKDLEFLRLGAESWSNIEGASLDYAIMEKADNVVVKPYPYAWSDLGSWDAVANEMKADENGVALTNGAISIDCKNTMLRSEAEHQKLVGIGLQDIIAVTMNDAVLISHKDRLQDVKNIVDQLKELQVPQAEIFPIVHRPWGWYESLICSQSFQVKRICVKPEGVLSLQSHQYRSEHWVVVEGIARVTVNQEEYLLKQGESTYIPLGARHRLENAGKSEMILIEVQLGDYLGEDDIVRFEDIYSRV